MLDIERETERQHITATLNALWEEYDALRIAGRLATYNIDSDAQRVLAEIQRLSTRESQLS